MKKYWKAFWMLVKYDVYVLQAAEERAFEIQEELLYRKQTKKFIENEMCLGRQFQTGRNNVRRLDRKEDPDYFSLLNEPEEDL